MFVQYRYINDIMIIIFYYVGLDILREWEMKELQKVYFISYNKIPGKRDRGRTKKSWSDVVESCLKKKNIRSTKCKRRCMKRIMSLKEASEICQNRVVWRSITR